MTDVSERLSEIRERVEAATEGPWYAEDAFGGEPFEKVITTEDWTLAASDKGDARFIAASRSDVPWLLSLVEEVGEALHRAVSDANYVHPCEPPRPTRQWICDGCRQVGNGPSLIEHKDDCPEGIATALRDAAQECADDAKELTQ